MKEIQLTRGKVAIVDDADFERLSQWSWHAAPTHKGSRTWYAKRWVQYDDNGGGPVFMHREILHPPADNRVDHRDGDGLNNQRANLRIATTRQNNQNRQRKPAGSTSRFKGVSWCRRSERWRAVISAGPIDKHGRAGRVGLGYFKDEIEAAVAYNDAARKYFGEFAVTNEVAPCST